MAEYVSRTTFTFVLFALLATAALANPIDWRQHSVDPPQTRIYEHMHHRHHHHPAATIGEDARHAAAVHLIRFARSLQPGAPQVPSDFFKKYQKHTSLPKPRRY